MTRIDFYELKSGRFSPDQLLFRLSLKAYQSEQSALLLTHNEQEAQRLDKFLWVCEDTSFIPHEISNTQQASSIINIHHQSLVNTPYDILINLHQDIPSHLGQFERIIELVHEQNKDTARQHFKFYKDRGYKINHNTV